MMPCNSVNSFTSSVVRSVFDSSAGLEDDAGAHQWGPVGPLALVVDHCRDFAAQPLHAQRFVEVAAQVFLEGDRLQHLDAVAQRNLLIGVPEEAGVVEAGAQHALVAVANQAIGIAAGVEHGEKMRQQLAVGIFQREIFLVIAHHRHQDFIGQRKVFRIEIAENDGRELRQVDDGVEQRLVFTPAGAGNGAGGNVEIFTDALLALGCAGDDRSLGQRGDVVRRHADGQRTVRQNAMAFAGAAGANAGKLQRHHFAVQQRDQPAHRAHEALGRLAAPVHVLRPVNAGNLFRQCLRQNVGSGAAFFLHGRGQILALRRRDFLESADRDVDLLRKGFGSGRRRTVLVGDLQRRARSPAR